MSFKDEYKKSYDDIVPDKEFIEQLSEKMNEEQHKRKKISYRLLTTFTGILLILFAGFITFHVLKGFSQSSKPIPQHMGKSLSTPSSEIGTFTTPKWYSPDDEPEKILSDFLERLGDREQLAVLYQSTENDFTKEQSVPEAELKQMIEKLQSAKVLAKEQKDKPFGSYYMAEFHNGDIIKFVVTDDGYFWFLDLEYMYQWQE